MMIRKGTLADTRKREWQQRLVGVLVVVLFVTSVFLPAAPAHADVLEWFAEDIPGTAGNVVVSGADVADFAVGVDGKTVWAVTALGNNIYKSVDAGITWSSVTPPGATSNITRVAIAPDDNDLVAIVADTTTVYVTTNGGTDWNSLGTPQENGGGACTGINDITISPDDSGTHYIAVAGIEAGPLGNVWYFNMGDIVSVWKESNDLPGWASITTDRAAAIEFSPNFALDEVLIAVTEEDDGGGGADSVRVEILSLNSLKWNNQANFSNYPVVLVSDDGISGLTSASISLAPDYLGSNLFLRVIFIGLAVAGDTDAAATSGIYRLKEDALKALTTGIKIHSVAYNGVKLVAGQYDDNKVHRSAGPLETTPTLSTTTSLKRPGGDSKVVVGWAGGDVLAGTAGNESSFNVSRDSGQSFNGISLIDTSLVVRDVAISADGSKIYLATDDGTDFSLWRKTSGWERVLAIDDKDSFIVRIAPNDSAVIYVADVGTQLMYYSDTGGDAKWLLRNVSYNIGDIAVERDNVLYIAVDGAATVSKSTNDGATWNLAESTSLESGNIHMIKSFGRDKLIVGSTTGYVSYSTTGSDNWTSIIRQVNSSTNPVQVTASGLSDSDFIYAGTSGAGQNVVRWKIGADTGWEDIISGSLTTTASDSPASTAMGLFGLVLQDGVLYTLASDGTDSGIWRTFSPSTASSTTPWSYKLTENTDDIALNDTPQALTPTTGSTKLWALDTNNNRLYSFTDTLTTVKPELSGPADNMTVKINSVSGNTYAVSFNWLRPSKANKYDLQIALDSNFDIKIASKTVPSSGTTTASNLNYIIGPGGDTSIPFMPDTTFYWRVRVASGGPLSSYWSEVRSFTIGSMPDIATPIIVESAAPAPAPEIVIPAPEITIQPPVIVIPPAPAPAPVAPEIVIPEPPVPPAPDTPAYIWVTIIIGTILITLVTILIMKPRWPVWPK